MTPSEFKEIQRDLGYTNAEMARELCVDISTVEYWRGGQRRITPGMDNAIRLVARVTENNWLLAAIKKSAKKPGKVESDG